MMKKNKFISFEGIEGAGKTTVIQYVSRQFDKMRVPYVVTREPGGTPMAEAIRHVLLGSYKESMTVETELLLMFAGRAQHISQVILPALKQGQWVLSDRFTDATIAYQGGGRGIPISQILELKNWIQRDLQPDRTLLLDISVKEGLGRIHSRGAKDRIEAEGILFFERVRQCYLQLADKEKERFRVIDASQAAETVQAQVWSHIEELL